MYNKKLFNKIESYLIENENILKFNSKDIKKDDVFIALKGNNYHGNRFINQALTNGARYIISNKDITSKQQKDNFLLVKNSKSFLSKIANKKRNSFKGKVIAITGSLGKTSLKENLKYFLSIKNKVSASIKSYNNELGVLLSIINSNLINHYNIFEVGTNNFNEIKKLTKIINPHQVIITNIAETHLENFINTRNIAKEKSDLFNPKYNSNIELLILKKLNTDEKFLEKLALKYKIKNIITFGEKECDYNITKIKIMNNNLSKIVIQKKNSLLKFKLPTSFEHHIINTIISIIVFEYNNLNINDIISKAQKIPITEGRGKFHEFKINKNKITLIDESYNASPVSMMNSIKYFERFKVKKKSKKFLIIGPMNELGKYSLNYHKKIVISLVKTSINKVLFCGEIYKKIIKKLELNLDKFIYINKEIEITRFLESEVNYNDIILAKGSNTTIVNKFIKKLLKKTEVS